MSEQASYSLPEGIVGLTGPVDRPAPGTLPLRGDLAHIALAGRYLAAHYVIRKMEQMGAKAKIREGFITDNHNLIVDVEGLKIMSPIQLEASINQITGVVTNGLFAARGADVLLMADQDFNIRTMTKKS